MNNLQRIYLARDRRVASLELRVTTCLRDCTVSGTDDHGDFIEKAWPVISSGEELVWQVLAWINGRGSLPSVDDLRAGLDEPNLRSVVAVLAGEGVAA